MHNSSLGNVPVAWYVLSVCVCCMHDSNLGKAPAVCCVLSVGVGVYVYVQSASAKCLICSFVFCVLYSNTACDVVW